MVKVISVHHFDSQIIQTCEKPSAVTTAPPDRLLIALPHHAIEVRDICLKEEAFSFPTVDRVVKLSYCSTGNYVATLEKKQTRQGKNVEYSRVYTNWEKMQGNMEEHNMRARIAGRVTPSSSQTGGDFLEMIELPVKFPNTTTITCCQETGNILVACDKILCLFQLVTRTHDISRLKFLDFELWPVTLELSFAPLELSMSEDVVAAVDNSCLHVFRINKGFARPTDWSSSATSSPRYTGKSKNSSKIESSKDDRPSSPIRFDALLKEATEGKDNHEHLKLSNGPIPVIAILPSLKTSLTNNPARNLRFSPFKPPGSFTMGVAIKEIPANEPWAEQMTTMVESLLQLELGSWENDQLIPDNFTCLALRPQYKLNPYPPKIDSSCPKLRSTAYGNLVAFNCLICTKQEGYMYYFPVYEGEMMSLGKCISEYNFTSPIKKIMLEPYLLYALTDRGLETYTLRTVQAIEEDQNIISPPPDEPVCLVGLKPFISVTDMILSKSYLIIISSPPEETDNQDTLYCLKLPSPGTFYTDILASAASYRFSSPESYFQLVSEAHVVLRAITKYHSLPEFTPIQMEMELFRESCALLAEHYLSCKTEKEWEAGYSYSLLGELNPNQMIDRIKKLEIEARSINCQFIATDGLLYYLKLCLISCDHDANIPLLALNTVLDLSEQRMDPKKPFLPSELILESSIIRQFSTERTIKMILSKINISGDIDPVDSLAVAVLYITKGKLEDAGHALMMVKDKERFIKTMLKNWTLLFDNTKHRGKVSPSDWESVTLSELAVILINQKPNELARILSDLVLESAMLNLGDVLQVFMTFLPSRIGSNSSDVGKVLLKFLELVFHGWYTSDPNWKPNPNNEVELDALKILMRSLLSNLLAKKTDENIPHEMFGGKRPRFLDQLPPFNDSNQNNYSSLLKLQCLLCSGWLTENSLSELIQFVTDFVPKDIGFSLLVLAQPEKGVEMIASNYPFALTDYARDVIKTESEWNHLVAVVQRKAGEEVEETGPYSQLLDGISIYCE